MAARKRKGGTGRTAKASRWIVTTSGKRPIDQVVKDLRAKGFAPDGKPLGEIGIIVGSAGHHAVDKLRKVAGVQDISPEAPDADVGPPNSGDTW